MWTEIVVAAISTGGALGGTWLGAFLNRRSALDTARQLADVEQLKYAQQRLWDERKVAYTELLAAITSMEQTASALSFGWHGGDPRGGDFFNEEYHRELLDEFFQKSERLRDQFNDRAIVLSDDLHELHEKWRKAIWNPDIDNEDERQRYLRYETMMRRFSLRFKELSRKELTSSF